jgi:hypothetical protein
MTGTRKKKQILRWRSGRQKKGSIDFRFFSARSFELPAIKLSLGD